MLPCMRYLALDVGTRRTGVAYLDSNIGIPLPLDTILHTSEKQVIDAVMTIIRERKIDRVIVGLPLLPSGVEGSQAAESRKIGMALQTAGITVDYRDERYTTPAPSQHKNALPTQKIDGDAAAACALLSGKIDH